jgi:hypothetical protein
MQSTPLVRHVLRDEAVTRGLGDIEARMLVDWLTDRAEQIAFTAPSDEVAWAVVRRLCRRGRAIARFVYLWSDPNSRGSALQFAASEKMHWPLPCGDVDAGELMEGILAWNDRQDEMVVDSMRRTAA